MTSMRRSVLTLTTAVIVGLGLTSSASAATSEFAFNVSSAKVGIGPVPSIPINATTLGGQPITLTGTTDGAGNLAVPKDKIAFPAVTIPIPQEVLAALGTALSGAGGTGGLNLGGLLGGLLGGTGATTTTRAVTPATRAAAPSFDLTSILALVQDVSVTAGITPTAAATGTVDPASGATTLNLGLGLGLGVNAKALGFAIKDLINCGISPMNFALTTGTAAVPGGTKTLTGKPYNPATGEVTLVGAVDTPAPGCKLNPLLNAVLGGSNPLAGLTIPALGAATVELTGTLAFKGDPVTPPVTTTTPAPPPVVTPDVKKVAAALLKVAKTLKVTGKTVAIKIACKIVDCKGSVKLSTLGASSASGAAKSRTIGSRSYNVKAGRTATIKVPLTKAAQTMMKKKKKAKVRVTASVAGGTAAQQTVTLAVPATKR